MAPVVPNALRELAWETTTKLLPWLHRTISRGAPSHRSCFGSSALGAGELVDVLSALHVIQIDSRRTPWVALYEYDAVRQFPNSVLGARFQSQSSQEKGENIAIFDGN